MKMHVLNRHRIACACGAAVVAILCNAGCGGGGTAPTTTQSPAQSPQSTITVTISPSSSVVVVPGGSITFSATVTGTANTAVDWAVQETNGGTITSAGVYTAPLKIPTNASVFHVIATSRADPSKSSTVQVVVGISSQTLLNGNVFPNATNAVVNTRIGFEALGYDLGNIGWAWHWSVKEGTLGGSIVANENDPSRATYTAPATQGTFHVLLVGETIETDAYGEPYFETEATATVTVLSAAAPGTFISTGSLLNKRGGYRASLLQDGRVLVSGGDPSSNSTQGTAEIYNPATGAFTPTGNLTSSRFNHAAVTLSDGRVLIAGGYVCTGNIFGCGLSSAEIYDPATGTFTATANMLAAHPCPNALRLPDGKVLILGGAPGPVTAEIFDPATGTFTAANASNSRESFKCPAAILLADGKILIASNWTPYELGPSQLEAFDPASGQYSIAAQISGLNETTATIAGGTTLTLLDTGRVLVAGTQDTECSYGDCEVTAFNVSSWLFDPSGRSVQPAGPMHIGRELFTHTLLLDGTVLLTGGSSETKVLAGAELYDPKTGVFSLAGDMNMKRYGHTAIRLNDGRVLILGGQGTSAELYYPARTTSPATESAGH